MDCRLWDDDDGGSDGSSEAFDVDNVPKTC